MASFRVKKRMRLDSSVYLLLLAFIAINRNEKKLDSVSNGVARSSTPVHKMLLHPIYLAKMAEIGLACTSWKNYCAPTSLLQLPEHLAVFRALLRLYLAHGRRSLRNQNLDQ